MDVIDDLYSYDTENPLSANKGRELREYIEDVETRVEELEASQINLSSYVTKIW